MSHHCDGNAVRVLTIVSYGLCVLAAGIPLPAAADDMTVVETITIPDTSPYRVMAQSPTGSACATIPITPGCAWSNGPGSTCWCTRGPFDGSSVWGYQGLGSNGELGYVIYSGRRAFVLGSNGVNDPATVFTPSGLDFGTYGLGAGGWTVENGHSALVINVGPIREGKFFLFTIGAGPDPFSPQALWTHHDLQLIALKNVSITGPAGTTTYTKGQLAAWVDNGASGGGRIKSLTTRLDPGGTLTLATFSNTITPLKFYHLTIGPAGQLQLVAGSSYEVPGQHLGNSLVFSKVCSGSGTCIDVAMCTKFLKVPHSSTEPVQVIGSWEQVNESPIVQGQTLFNPGASYLHYDGGGIVRLSGPGGATPAYRAGALTDNGRMVFADLQLTPSGQIQLTPIFYDPQLTSGGSVAVVRRLKGINGPGGPYMAVGRNVYDVGAAIPTLVAQLPPPAQGGINQGLFLGPSPMHSVVCQNNFCYKANGSTLVQAYPPPVPPANFTTYLWSYVGLNVPFPFHENATFSLLSPIENYAYGGSPRDVGVVAVHTMAGSTHELRFRAAALNDTNNMTILKAADEQPFVFDEAHADDILQAALDLAQPSFMARGYNDLGFYRALEESSTLGFSTIGSSHADCTGASPTLSGTGTLVPGTTAQFLIMGTPTTLGFLLFGPPHPNNPTGGLINGVPVYVDTSQYGTTSWTESLMLNSSGQATVSHVIPNYPNTLVCAQYFRVNSACVENQASASAAVCGAIQP